MTGENHIYPQIQDNRCSACSPIRNINSHLQRFYVKTTGIRRLLLLCDNKIGQISNVLRKKPGKYDLFHHPVYIGT